jgi:DNA replication and repair protein RecF
MLQRLRLGDFRNFGETELDLDPRFTILHGHNGAGKTNLIEAIYLVATLRSFRTTDLSALVRQGAQSGRVTLVVDEPITGVATTLEVTLERRSETSTRRTARADGKVVRSAADFYGRVRAVLFTPEDLAVLRGSPSGRRQFIDRMLFARDRAHIVDVQHYEKLLRSRNHVLKREDLRAAEREPLLDTYEAGLSQVGARVWTRRSLLTDELRSTFASAFHGIHGRSGPDPDGTGFSVAVDVHYRSRLGDESPSAREAVLRGRLRESRPVDLQRRMTTVGPHRDDVEVTLDGNVAGTFASQGQCRALVLALKLAELETSRVATGLPPLLLLDDVSSELDPVRSTMLFETLVGKAGQCILTTTSPAFIALPQASSARYVLVDRGRLDARDAPPVQNPQFP